MKKSKYSAVKQTIDGHTFDSKIEGQRYVLLKAQQVRGEIRDLKLQPVFVIQEGFTRDGKKYRPITYKADFMYYDNRSEKWVAEDVKGIQTEAFKIKWKLVLFKFPDITFEIITRENLTKGTC